MANTQLEKRLQLLEEYAHTLQRQNFAKNNETSLLYQQLASLQEQNCMLKGFIEAMKQRQRNFEQQEINIRGSITASRNFEAELKASIDMNSMKIVADDIRLQLESKQEQILQLQSQNVNLKEELAKVKQQLSSVAEKMIKSEEKVRKQCAQIKKLEEQNYNIKNSRCEAKGISFARLEVDKLVRQNNQLIQKIRVLQKQKNNYYSELRMTSPLKSRSPNSKAFLELSRKKCSKDKWNVMEEKIRAIRNQNEQLKANLAIE